LPERWREKYHPVLWGIVTGKLSGVVIVDVGSPEGREKFEASGPQPHVLTPRGGAQTSGSRANQ